MISPPINRGMTVLNRDLFRTSVQLLAVRVPARKVFDYRKVLDNDIFHQLRMQCVIRDGDSSVTRLVLLKPEITDLEGLSEASKQLIQKESLEIVKHNLEIKYEHWTTDEILKSVLPDELNEIPTSFTQVGHIAHMNLRDEYLPWKTIIGQVILDKNKSISTVVNKLDTIDNTFRFFKMEVLAGENNMITEMRESGCRFRFDFSQVYWNSRLHTEHERLVGLFKKNDYICDVFAGVGPFALPAAKKGCIVFANDLNPASYKYLQENIKLNKIKPNAVVPYNLDGREFIRKAVKDLQECLQNNTLSSISAPSSLRTFDHFVMNLPASAIEFLDTFNGLYSNIIPPPEILPMVHCHCFTKSETPHEDILERVCASLSAKLDPSEVAIHMVRSVAPNKDMYCISFRLSETVAFGSDVDGKRRTVEGKEQDLRESKKPKKEDII